MSDVTRILSQIESGDQLASEQLLPLVYNELRRLAGARLAQETPGHTLQATALVHEAYLRLVPPAPNHGSAAPSPESPAPPAFDSRGHFFAAAAEAMRRILVESARRKASLKRGGQMQRLPLDDIATPDSSDADELLALNDALEGLAQADPQAAQIVKLRYFAGLTMEQAAEALGISERTAYYAWEYARSWLRQAIRNESP